MDAELLRHCWFLTGPTASGKSAAALELAEQLRGEIVALDSMTLYRGMDIGTAKPSLLERQRVPHHLVDILDPHEESSLADYVRLAESACRDILARGRVPLFVGGTGLYLRGVLRGVFEGPAANAEIRTRWEQFLQEHGAEALHHELARVDPPLATKLHPHDTRRIIRGLEVFEQTGLPLSAQQQQPALSADQRPAHVFWLHPPRDWLYERIDRRVEQMFAQGLVDEVRQLLDRDQPLSDTARQALGYKEVIEHLKGGPTLSETCALIQQRTRQFAKRQHTWFRNLVECRPIEMTGQESAPALASRIHHAQVDRRQ